MHARNAFCLTLLALAAAAPVFAAAEPAPDIQELRRQIAEQDARLKALEAKAPPASPSPLKFTGDLRLRQESNFGSDTARDRNRASLRARLAAIYSSNGWLEAGARLATGDADDPNSTDVTLSNFDDDLDVSLDQAYLRAHRGGFEALGGKFANPFVRTELVWDGDVNPEGAAASYQLALGADSSLRAIGLYFVVDEQAAARDSHMNGLQLAFETQRGDWQFNAAAASYDYDLHSLVDADSGDTRSNLLTPDGSAYLSGFHLLDFIAGATWQGLGPAWPLRIIGDYVRNLDAATDADRGYGADLFLGRASQPGDVRLNYGYAAAEADAVLAAFSQDNNTLATHYRQHTLAVDYVAAAHTTLNATWYLYRPYDGAFAANAHDWLSRVRLSAMLSF